MIFIFRKIKYKEKLLTYTEVTNSKSHKNNSKIKFSLKCIYTL